MFKKMKHFNLPYAIFNLYWWMGRNGTAKDREPLIHYIEWFSGVQSVRHGVELYGYTAMAFDVCNDSMEDFISLQGMVTALVWLFRRLPGAGHHFATVCSTWIWISRSSTLRSDAQPMGIQPRSKVVEQANEQVSVMVLYIWLIMSSCLSCFNKLCLASCSKPPTDSDFICLTACAIS